MTYKKINPKERKYHYIELSVINIVLYDSEMDMPIAMGSKVIVANVIKNLPIDVKISYYKIENDNIKLKKTYIGKKKSPENDVTGDVVN